VDNLVEISVKRKGYICGEIILTLFFNLIWIKIMIDNIPDSAYAKYQTTNSLLEITSVKWIDNLFNREGIKANFKTEDKNPDIDGTFEILENYRFNLFGLISRRLRRTFIFHSE